MDATMSTNNNNINDTPSSTVTSNDKLLYWHRKFGHVNPATLVQMSKYKTVSNMPVLQGNVICNDCIQAKQSAVPHNVVAHRKTSMFELIHSDTSEIQTETMFREQHFISFIDDYTRYIWVFALEQRTQVTQTILNFIELVKVHYKCDIKEFKSDNAPEHKSLALQSKYAQLSIVPHYTVPYLPEQNGLSEKFIDTLKDMIRSMLFHTG